MKRAIVVAHGDDEVLWAGGLPIRYPGDWTIIVCSIPQRDPHRIEHFKKACEKLGVKYLINDDKDFNESVPLQNLDKLNLDKFDHIITHNQWGEYGHPHHKQVHAHITRNYPGKNLSFFGWRLGAHFGEHKINLTTEEAQKKMAALMEYTEKWRGLLRAFYQAGFEEDSYDGYKIS